MGAGGALDGLIQRSFGQFDRTLCTLCAPVHVIRLSPEALSCAEVVCWSSLVGARKSISVLCGRGTHRELSAFGGLGLAPFGDRSARFAKLLANDFWVVLSMAKAFSSRRAPYVPMLLPRDSRYSAAPGWRAGRSR